jgi:hypothetical protein
MGELLQNVEFDWENFLFDSEQRLKEMVKTNKIIIEENPEVFNSYLLAVKG